MLWTSYVYRTLALFLFAVGEGLTTEDDPDDDEAEEAEEAEAEDDALLTRDRCSAVTLVVYLFELWRHDKKGRD